MTYIFSVPRLSPFELGIVLNVGLDNIGFNIFLSRIWTEARGVFKAGQFEESLKYYDLLVSPAWVGECGLWSGQTVMAGGHISWPALNICDKN